MKASFSNLPAAELLDLLIAKAPELRRAGVVEVCGVILAPHREQNPAQGPAQEDEESLNHWDDAIGLGLEPGTKIPSFGRQVEGDNGE